MNRFLQFIIIAALATVTATAAISIPLAGTASLSNQVGLPNDLTFTPVALTGDLVTLALGNDGTHGSDVQYGAFNLSGGHCDSNCDPGGSFDLTLSFTLPNPTSGNPVTADFTVTGHINHGGNGSVTIAFDTLDTANTVTFDNGSYHGSFDVVFDGDDTTIDVSSEDPPAYVDISNITYTADNLTGTPEPTVTLLFGTMLAGVGFLTRRKLLGKSAR